ncbi:MAG TPA: hypothetical protein VFE05_09655 [Longimicrobiaceae bacterium]|jgi:hypothetical protein|nr:hypothetical protein [Longimicrobiaceae bacterium]
MTLKVGLIVGREWSFPPAFIEEVNRRDEGVTAEFVKLGAPRIDEPAEYAVIIDRISHEVPFYRSFLKQAVLQGTTVVNNPFMWTADDKFFGGALATQLGIAHPKTVVLPHREYIPGIVHDESLRNLQYPLDWQGIVDYIGMPCILKDAHGGGWRDVYVCRTMDELIDNYNQSGTLTMIVQEFIEWEQFIRCICLGQDEILPIKYDPKERRYHVEHDHLSAELGQRVVDDSRKLVQALGYDMNSMEWAVRDGVPYAIDFMNPAPDMDVNSLTPHYFDWVVKHMADMAIRFAKEPREQDKQVGWQQLFAGSRRGAAGEAFAAEAGKEGGNGRSSSADGSSQERESIHASTVMGGEPTVTWTDVAPGGDAEPEGSAWAEGGLSGGHGSVTEESAASHGEQGDQPSGDEQHTEGGQQAGDAQQPGDTQPSGDAQASDANDGGTLVSDGDMGYLPGDGEGSGANANERMAADGGWISGGESSPPGDPNSSNAGGGAANAASGGASRSGGDGAGASAGGSGATRTDVPGGYGGAWAVEGAAQEDAGSSQSLSAGTGQPAADGTGAANDRASQSSDDADAGGGDVRRADPAGGQRGGGRSGGVPDGSASAGDSPRRDVPVGE